MSIESEQDIRELQDQVRRLQADLTALRERYESHIHHSGNYEPIGLPVEPLPAMGD